MQEDPQEGLAQHTHVAALAEHDIIVSERPGSKAGSSLSGFGGSIEARIEWLPLQWTFIHQGA